MALYTPLAECLAASERETVRMTFAEISKLIGKKLPASATGHQAWWANEVAPSHVQNVAWDSAGYEVDQVDRSAKWVRFRRKAGST